MALPANLRVNVAFPFPSLVTAVGPVIMTKANGIWTIGLNITQLAPILTGGDYSTKMLLVYDGATGSFQKASLEQITTAARGGPGYPSGRWFTSESYYVGGGSTLALVANTLYAMPFFVNQRSAWTAIAVNVTVASAAHSVRLGIFNTGTDALPSTLVLDAGTVSVASTGVAQVAITQTLEVGYYYLVVASDSAPPTLTAQAGSSALTIASAFVGASAPNLADYSQISRAFTFGALSGASPFGAATLTNGNMPLIWMLKQ